MENWKWEIFPILNDKVNFKSYYLLQGKLELVTGANAGSMVLEVYNREKEFVCSLTNDNSLLGSFPIDDGMRIHVPHLNNIQTLTFIEFFDDLHR